MALRIQSVRKGADVDGCARHEGCSAISAAAMTTRSSLVRHFSQ